MKKIEINNLPAGSLILIKRYNIFKRLYAKLFKKQLKYNEVWLDPVGNNSFEFKDTALTKHDVTTFVPKKKYSKEEIMKLFEVLLSGMLSAKDDVEAILLINLVRPKTFEGSTLEELLDNNRYYNKKELK